MWFYGIISSCYSHKPRILDDKEILSGHQDKAHIAPGALKTHVAQADAYARQVLFLMMEEQTKILLVWLSFVPGESWWKLPRRT